jgi:uncharacterized protein (TIGR02466 family)
MLEEKIMFFYPVYTTTLEQIDNDKLEKEIIKRKKEDSGLNLSNVGGWHSKKINAEDYENRESEVKFLLDEIQTKAEYLYFIWKINKEPELKSFWFNINEYKDINEAHSHPNNYFSFCYYVKTPENSGNIEFLRDDSSEHYEIDSEITPYTYATFSIKPHSGMLVAFPSYTKHRVHPNLSQEKRISIALNFK